MSCRVRYTSAAIVDRADAVKFYRRQGASVAEAFTRDLRHTVSLLSERPLLGTPYDGGTRRKLLTRFPYPVIYHVQEDVIRIFAVKHDRRDPEYWKDRLHLQEPE